MAFFSSSPASVQPREAYPRVRRGVERVMNLFLNTQPSPPPSRPLVSPLHLTQFATGSKMRLLQVLKSGQQKPVKCPTRNRATCRYPLCHITLFNLVTLPPCARARAYAHARRCARGYLNYGEPRRGIQALHHACVVQIDRV